MSRQIIVARDEPSVILRDAKDLLAGIKRRKMILRCAQDDKLVKSFVGGASAF